MNEIVPTDTLARNATRAIGGIGGGGALLILGVAAGSPIGGIIGIALALGGAAIAKSSPEDRAAGGVMAAAGIVTGLAALGIGGGGLLTLGGFGLLGYGGYNLYKFLKGMQTRR